MKGRVKNFTSEKKVRPKYEDVTLRKQIPEVRIYHILREANQGADQLAKEGVNLGGEEEVADQ